MTEHVPPNARYRVADLSAIEPVRCPCGWAKRAFTDDPDGVATLHITRIEADSRAHYHKKLTEVYYILEGQGHMELDGERIAVRPGMAVLIKPLCRHRAVGELTVLIVPTPAFDEKDEHFDE